MIKIARYKKENDVSYALGTTVCIELLKANIKLVQRIFVSDKASSAIQKEIAHLWSGAIIKDDKAFNVLSPKENCLVIAEFKKPSTKLIENAPHIVLVNPSDAGNLGTIIRSALGFGVNDVAIIEPAVDVYVPKTVRSSMGALFHTRVECFKNISEYLQKHKERQIYSFMLDGELSLSDIKFTDKNKTTLIFGNEAEGLPQEYKKFSKAVLIKHSKLIDSLNLSNAVSIALWELSKPLNPQGAANK